MHYVEIIFEALVFSTLSFLFGNFILQKVERLYPASLDISFVLSLTLGYGLMSYCGLILGLLGIFTPGVLYYLYLLIFLLTFKTIRIYFQTSLKKDFWKNQKIRFYTFIKKETLLKIVLALWIIFYFIIALSPTEMSKDGLAYHIPFAVQIVHENGISFPISGNMNYGHLPLSSEILYAMTIGSFGNLEVIKLLQYIAILLLSYGICSFAYKKFVHKNLSYFLCALILSCMPLIQNSLSGGMVDIWCFLFGIMSILKLIEWLWKDEKDASFTQLAISGSLLGFSLGVKYLSLFFMAISGFLFIYAGIMKKWNIKKYMRAGCAYYLPALIIGSFWYIKNIIYTGNPVYPLFASARGQEFATEVNDFVVARTLPNLFLFPFELFGKETFRLPFGIFSSLSFIFSTIGIVVLFIRRKMSSFLFSIVIITAVYLFITFFWSHQIRFIAPALVINTIIIAFCIDGGKTYEKYAKISTWLLLACTTILFLMSAYSFKEKFVCAVGIRDIKSCYAEIEGGAVYTMDYINAHLQNQKIIQYWTPYYEYSTRNGNMTIDLKCSGTNIDACLKEKNIWYYIDETKARIQATSSPEQKYRLDTAAFFLKNGRKLHEFHDEKRKTDVILYELPHTSP